MSIHDIIFYRKSIRKYTEQTVSDEVITKLLKCSVQAPSAKNRQPWFFYVINDPNTKHDFIMEIKSGIENLLSQYTSININRPDILNAKNSISAMEQAASIIIVTHKKRYRIHYDDGVEWYLNANDIEVADILSIGAAIQNLLLYATDLGLGTLWVCDIFYAYPKIKKFLGTSDAILSAICIGYANENQPKPSRLSGEEVFKYIKKE